MKIRIKFRKYGIMKFIGHLDIMRYFQKAMRRRYRYLLFRRLQSPYDHVLRLSLRRRPYQRRRVPGH